MGTSVGYDSVKPVPEIQFDRSSMPNVLVVDDSATQATQIAAILKHRGADVRTAGNGVEALAALQEQLPDVVVTDMQMPELNGVELIRKMQSDFPLVPSILVTAFGSEGLAAEALGVGAANYISKEHLQILLPEMVRRVADYERANSDSLFLKGSLNRRAFDFILDCSIERIAPLTSLLIRLLAAMNVLHTGDRIRIAEALHYLLFHSIVYENLEHPVDTSPISLDDAIRLVESKRGDEATRELAERNVSLNLEINDREARFVVTHEGSGESLHHAPLPGTPQSYSDERGRGMLLLTSVMDEVFLDKAGGCVTLVKYI